MTVGGTVAYEQEAELPALVAKAVELARSLGFEFSCLPAQGRLLQVLARGRTGGVIGETGTGCGVGLAWMATAVEASTRLVSVEIDDQRAAAARALFIEHPNVTVLTGGWKAIVQDGPFDLLVLDGGGTGKAAEIDAEPADPTMLLRSGGTLVVDDFVPSETWPPTQSGEIDHARLHWLQHPELATTEIRVTGTMSTLIGTRR